MKKMKIMMLMFALCFSIFAIEKQTEKPDITVADSIQIAKITFIELGSIKCIPCKMMKPVMKEIEVEYADTVKIVFHDVWTEEGKKYEQ